MGGSYSAQINGDTTITQLIQHARTGADRQRDAEMQRLREAVASLRDEVAALKAMVQSQHRDVDRWQRQQGVAGPLHAPHSFATASHVQASQLSTSSPGSHAHVHQSAWSQPSRDDVYHSQSQPSWWASGDGSGTRTAAAATANSKAAANASAVAATGAGGRGVGESAWRSAVAVAAPPPVLGVAGGTRALVVFREANSDVTKLTDASARAVFASLSALYPMRAVDDKVFAYQHFLDRSDAKAVAIGGVGDGGGGGGGGGSALAADPFTRGAAKASAYPGAGVTGPSASAAVAPSALPSASSSSATASTQTPADVVLVFWPSAVGGADDRSPKPEVLERLLHVVPFGGDTQFVFVVMRSYHTSMPFAVTDYALDPGTYTRHPKPVACVVTFGITATGSDFWAQANAPVLAAVAAALRDTAARRPQR